MAHTSAILLVCVASLARATVLEIPDLIKTRGANFFSVHGPAPGPSEPLATANDLAVAIAFSAAKNLAIFAGKTSTSSSFTSYMLDSSLVTISRGSAAARHRPRIVVTDAAAKGVVCLPRGSVSAAAAAGRLTADGEGQKARVTTASVGQGHGIVATVDRGSASASASAGHGASASVGHGASTSAGHGASASVGHGASTSAGHGASASVGHGASTSAGHGVSASAGHDTSASAGYGASAKAGHSASVTAGHGTSASSEHGVSVDVSSGHAVAHSYDGHASDSTSASSGYKASSEHHASASCEDSASTEHDASTLHEASLHDGSSGGRASSGASQPLTDGHGAHEYAGQLSGEISDVQRTHTADIPAGDSFDDGAAAAATAGHQASASAGGGHASATTGHGASASTGGGHAMATAGHGASESAGDGHATATAGHGASASAGGGHASATAGHEASASTGGGHASAIAGPGASASAGGGHATATAGHGASASAGGGHASATAGHGTSASAGDGHATATAGHGASASASGDHSHSSSIELGSSSSYSSGDHSEQSYSSSSSSSGGDHSSSLQGGGGHPAHSYPSSAGGGGHASSSGSGSSSSSSVGADGRVTLHVSGEHAQAAALGSDGTSVTLSGDGSYAVVDESSCDCVPAYLCDEDGYINTFGSGIIDIRTFADTPRVRAHASKCQPNEACCRHRHGGEKAPVGWLPGSCGTRAPVRLDRRIVSGEASRIGEFPWMVALLKQVPATQYEPARHEYLCGGSLVADNVVLTGAHCVKAHLDAQLIARIGEWDTASEDPLYPHQDLPVVRIVYHDKFNEHTLFNDVALLRLAKPVEVAPHINTLCLPTDDDYHIDYSNCVATGWGQESFENSVYSSILKKVPLSKVDRQQCQTRMRQTRLGAWFQLHDTFLCAGGHPRVDTCKGDGGSPLACLDRSQPDEEKYVQIGIVAWGINCGRGGFPGIYVDIIKMLPWIRQHLTLLADYD